MSSESSEVLSAECVESAECIEIKKKFEEMKTLSMELRGEYSSLPELMCNDCDGLVSFGGCETFEINIFTYHDICQCKNKRY